MALGRPAERAGPGAALTLLWLLVRAAAPPAMCPPGDEGCRLLSVADLFDRVIRHSGRIHSLSTELLLNCTQNPARISLEKFFVLIYKREELTYLILKLLQAWKEPLSHFNQHIENLQELPGESLSKAKQISNMVHELETGVEKVTEKMQSMGIISNSLHGVASSEAAGVSISNEANVMSDSDFIHCFRRDSNKVQSYLKILKCRIMPENSC
uniref:Prolactin-like n=1 Tax=Coturnix japonica TaxID=93934 RepID=A0A8C2TT57_COTJA